MKIKVGLGQDSHKFETQNKKPLILGGVLFNNCPGLKGNSDSDVILHSLTNAISSITGKNILGAITDKLCKQNIIDSTEYVKLALRDLNGYYISHISIAIECLVPKITPKIDAIKSSIANLVNTNINNIGITATTGEGLTAFGKGEGIQVFSIVTVNKQRDVKKQA